MKNNEATVLRTLSWFASFGHAPTAFAIFKWQMKPEKELSFEQVQQTLEDLRAKRLIKRENGTFFLKQAPVKDYSDRINNSISSIRKFRKAKRVSDLVSFLSPVKAVAVCNTQLPLMDARDASDIDFFVISAPGQTWLARFLCLTPFALLKKRPGQVSRDAIDFSFFLSEDADSLEQITGEGREYIAAWIYSLIPLSGHAVVRDFQDKNAWASEIFPLAKPDFKPLNKKLIQLPLSWLNFVFLKDWQLKKIPSEVKEASEPGVILNDDIIKTHVKDLAAEYVKNYQELCKKLQIES